MSIEQKALSAINLSLPDDPPSSFKIFAFGKTATQKGEFVFDQDSAKSVMDAYAQNGIDLHADYEHQSGTKRKAPAAAWFKPEIREDGLYATDVKWTPRALRHLRNKEYRYLSPAFHYEADTGRVTRLVNVALTNLPATHGIAPLVAAKEDPPGETTMRTVMKALGLKEDAGEAEALSETTKLASFRKEVVTLSEKSSEAEALGQLAAWKASHAEVQKVSAELEKLKAEQAGVEVSRLVADGMRAGKIQPSQKDWAEGFGKQHGIAALKSYLEATAPVAKTKTQGSPEPAKLALVELSSEEERIARLCGNDPKKVREFAAKTGLFGLAQVEADDDDDKAASSKAR